MFSLKYSKFIILSVGVASLLLFVMNREENSQIWINLKITENFEKSKKEKAKDNIANHNHNQKDAQLPLLDPNNNNIQNLNNKIQNLNIIDKTEDEPGPVLFLACGIDGYWSNFRLVPAALYVARAYNLTYAEQELFYKFQDTGSIKGTDGPIGVFDLFDRKHMSKYIHVVNIKEFLDLDLGKSKLTFGAISRAVRCSGTANRESLKKGFKKFFGRYNVSVDNFLQNVISVKRQDKYMKKLGHLPKDIHLMMAGSPWARGGNVSMTTDFKRSGMFRTFSDMPIFYQQSIPLLKWNEHILDLKEKAKSILGIGPEESFGAVHIRRGNTYGYGNVRQITTKEILDAFNRGNECIKKPLTTIFVSTIQKSVKKEVLALSQVMPKIKIVAFDDLDTWRKVGGDYLASRKATQIRSAVEMALWSESDVFVGSRSSMSAVVQLLRLAERKGEDACNRFGMKKWLEAYVRKSVP